MKKKSTLLNILHTHKGGRLVDNTNGPSTPSLLATTPDKTVETIPSIFLLLRPTPVSPKHKK